MTSALILAAGSVFGDDVLGPTKNVGKISAIRRIIMVFRQAGVDRTVVVTGFDAEALQRHCAHMGAVFLHNEEYESGDMLTSVKTGLGYLRDKCDRCFISPVDFPLFSAETVKKMRDVDEPVVIPMHNNKTGHPILLSGVLFGRVLEYHGSNGLEGALSGDGVERRFVDVPDEGVLAHVRSNADISDIIEGHSLRQIRPEVRLRLLGEKAFFGPGTMQLLSLTMETGSLKHAAFQMGVSYSKALQMIKDIEDQLGYAVLVTRQGGRKGGGSVVTEGGIEFMTTYEAFTSACERAVRELFDEHFGS